MILSLLGLGVLIFIGFFLKELDYNPFNTIFGIKKSVPPKEKQNKVVDPDLTWEQWENGIGKDDH